MSLARLNLILAAQKKCKFCPHQKSDVDKVCDLDCVIAFKKGEKQKKKKLKEKRLCQINR